MLTKLYMDKTYEGSLLEEVVINTTGTTYAGTCDPGLQLRHNINTFC